MIAVAVETVERADVRLRCTDGSPLPLPVHHWKGEPSAGELAVVLSASPPVLDVGCGPGRLVLALARRGIPALGIDTAPAAVHLGTSRGAPILERSIFDHLPCSGRWGAALLFDGSIGIGGDPARLLRRVAGLLRARGMVLAELDPEARGVQRMYARIERGAATGPWFPWSRVGPDGIERLAVVSGLGLLGRWEEDGRWFARLIRA